MNARNWILAVGVLVLLPAESSAQQLSPDDRAPYALPPSAVWAQVSYPQPMAPKANAPRPLAPSQVFDSPPASEDQSPYVTRSEIITRTAYQSPWSSWTTQEDPEACGPACQPPIGPDCNVCEPAVVKSILGQFYVRVEALALRRSHPRARAVAFDVTTNTVLLDARNLTFPVALGQRFVAGYEFNPSNAIEFTFFENQNWKAVQQASGSNSLFLSGSTPTTIADLSAHHEDYKLASAMSLSNHTSLRNLELNYLKLTTYDKFTVLAGYRYVDLHDKLDLSSTFVDPLGNPRTSDYLIDARSRLHGGQLGAIFRQRVDLFTFEVVGKGGLYNNFAAQSQFVGDQNNTTVLRDVFRMRKRDLAFVGEVGVNGVAHLNNNLLFRFGYNLYWIDHVALAPNQLDFTDTTGSGTGVILKHGNLFIHGVGTGLEARW